MNNLILSKTKNLTIRLIKNWNIYKLKIENYNLKEQIIINILILTGWVLILIPKYLLFHNSISKSHKVIHLLIILGDLPLLKDSLLKEQKVEKRNLNLNRKKFLIKEFLRERCMEIFNKKHQKRYI